MRERVAVTTSTDRFGEIAGSLRSNGLHPVALPCIEVDVAAPETLAEVRSMAGSVDWIVLTSPRAVSSVWNAHPMPPVAVAAVGHATASAAMNAGGRVELVAEDGAADLVDRLRAYASGRSLLFPRARGADPRSIDVLETAGARVVAREVYATKPVAPGDDPVEAAIFGSPSAVQGWCRARTFDGLVLAAIGSTTEAALAGEGHSADVTPDKPGYENLVSALADHLRTRSTHE